jgi:hypothetical protein
VGRSITAREATVKTATVDVKALTISGKQVTLSVFRQLKDESIVDGESADLRGVPWGVVNYFWGDCAKSLPHLHVVWQKGEELRRACAWSSPEIAIGWRERNRDVENWFQAWVLLAISETGVLPVGVSRITETGYRKNRLYAKIGGRGLSAELSDDEAKLLQWKMPEPPVVRTTKYVLSNPSGFRNVPLDPDELRDAHEQARVQHRDNCKFAQGQRDELISDIRRQAAHLASPTSAAEVFATLTNELIPSLVNFERKWKEQYAALADLDHLFIAV